MNSSKYLRFAVAAVFAGGAAVSQAAFTSVAVPVASELPTNGILLTGGAAQIAATSPITTFLPSAGQNLQINVTLDNGAKFSGSPTATCQNATGSTATATLNLGGNGSNNAVFTVGLPTAGTSGGYSSCQTLIPALTVTGAHNTVNANITYTYGTLASSVDAGAVITWKKGLAATLTGNQNPVALVTGGFINMSGGISGSPSLNVSAGTLRFSMAGISAASTSVDLSWNISAGDAMAAGSGSITLAGLPLGALDATSSLWIVTASEECTAGTKVATATGGLASVTFSGLNTATMSAGVNVCMRFNGTTAIPEGAITATVGARALTNYTTDTSLSNSTLSTFSRNGSSTRAMNIPNVTNTDQAFIRVTNTSPIAGKLYGTMYGQDGVVLGTANVVLATNTVFTPNVTLVFDAATLKTTMGISADWAGRAQLVLTAETTGMRAHNLIRVANGTLVSVGADTSTNNN
jgi:hypothetical protein